MSRHLDLDPRELADLATHPRFLDVWSEHLDGCERCFRLFQSAVAEAPNEDGAPTIVVAPRSPRAATTPVADGRLEPRGLLAMAASGLLLLLLAGGAMVGLPATNSRWAFSDDQPYVDTQVRLVLFQDRALGAWSSPPPAPRSPWASRFAPH